MNNETVRSASGRTLDELNMDAIRNGELTTEDFRISGDTLAHQADMAESAGYRQLAQSLRRAAELTAVSNQEVQDIYATLRPGRTTYRQLIALAERLESDLGAPLTSALVREAADVYLERGLVKEG